MKESVLVTGGYGFIGSNWIQSFYKNYVILNVDNLSIGSNTDNLKGLSNVSEDRFLEKDICDLTIRDLEKLDFVPDYILHFAAESHVDRSIEDPNSFIRTNVNGTTNMLNLAVDIKATTNKNIRFIHVSTDEVFGSLTLHEKPFNEDTPYKPQSPYSASKAASDHLVRAYGNTYGLNYSISNCCNNYGPRQYPEKLIPVVIKKALAGEDIPIYGDGSQIREWIYVDDHNEALNKIMLDGDNGHTYCIGSGEEMTNISLVYTICGILDRLYPKEESYRNQIRFISDRPGHDYRYAINSEKLRFGFDWQPKTRFQDGLEKTINWYLELFNKEC